MFGIDLMMLEVFAKLGTPTPSPLTITTFITYHEEDIETPYRTFL